MRIANATSPTSRSSGVSPCGPRGGGGGGPAAGRPAGGRVPPGLRRRRSLARLVVDEVEVEDVVVVHSHGSPLAGLGQSTRAARRTPDPDECTGDSVAKDVHLRGEGAWTVSSAAYALPDRELVLDRYRPLRPLGRGGSGSVWLARDERTGLEIALKIVPREGKRAARAMREMEAASRLRHERCVRAYDFAGDDGHVYIAYEYVAGARCARLLRAGRADDRDAVEVAAQVLEGLAHAHRHGIVHRDVKPSNVLVEDASEVAVRVLDFGLAQFDEADTLTAVGDVPGTLAYIAPERLDGRGGVGTERRLGGRRDAVGGARRAPTRSGACRCRRWRPRSRTARRRSPRRGGDLPRRLLAAVDRALAVDPGAQADGRAARGRAPRGVRRPATAATKRRPRRGGGRRRLRAPAPCAVRRRSSGDLSRRGSPCARDRGRRLAAAVLAAGPCWRSSRSRRRSARFEPRGSGWRSRSSHRVPARQRRAGRRDRLGGARRSPGSQSRGVTPAQGSSSCLGPLLAPLGLLALLPLAVQPARGPGGAPSTPRRPCSPRRSSQGSRGGRCRSRARSSATSGSRARERPTDVVQALALVLRANAALPTTALALALVAVALPYARSPGTLGHRGARRLQLGLSCSGRRPSRGSASCSGPGCSARVLAARPRLADLVQAEQLNSTERRLPAE